MKKRVLSVLLSMMMVVSLAGCGSSGGSDEEKKDKAKAEVTGDGKILGAGIYSASDNFNS